MGRAGEEKPAFDCRAFSGPIKKDCGLRRVYCQRSLKLKLYQLVSYWRHITRVGEYYILSLHMGKIDAPRGGISRRMRIYVDALKNVQLSKLFVHPGERSAEAVSAKMVMNRDQR